MAEKIKLLIDTDLGDDVDDAAAFMFILNSPEFDIEGVTTVFKDTEKRAEMVRELLSMYGRRDVPVIKGYGRALVEDGTDPTEEPIQYGILRERHLPSEYESSISAEDFIIEKVKNERELVILAMGPMTNLAMACLKAPEIMKRAYIVGMGGAFFNSRPEWNIVCDPEAVKIVFDTVDHMVMMGLDVTKYLKISDERFEILTRDKGPRMAYFSEGVDIFRKKTGYPLTFHDVLLPVWLLDKNTVELQKGSFTVELSGRLTRGTLVDKNDYYDTRICTEGDFYFAKSVDTERFYSILEERF